MKGSRKAPFYYGGYMNKSDKAKFTLYGTVYVVQMYRWGDTEQGHSYTAGVFTSEQDAKDCCIAEKIYRGGKYEGEVWVHDLNKWNGKSPDAMQREIEEYNTSMDKHLGILVNDGRE